MDFFHPNKKVIPLPLRHCFHFENGVQFEFNAEIKLRNFLSEKERANKACCFSQFNFFALSYRPNSNVSTKECVPITQKK